MSNAEASTMGRPPLKDSQRRRNRIVMLFTDAEIAEIQAFIEQEGIATVSDFGREAMRRMMDTAKKSED